MTVTLSFHGAAGMVTGSSYRITHPNGTFLVDCGMFQGNKSVRALNNNPFPYNPASIDYLLLTHAHIDHTGLIPKLFAHGFSGPVWCTKPTTGLLRYMLPDSAAIQESEAERTNRKNERRGLAPIEPLYTKEDAKKAINSTKGRELEKWISPGPGVKFRFWNAGHILGSASIEVHVEDDNGDIIRILFSGDIGPDEKVFYQEPEAPSGFDYILSESTYGGRNRDDYTLEQRRKALGKQISEGLARGGNIVIPAFAVERSQELLHDIGYLLKQGKIDPIAVFLDSPLARKITTVFKKYAHTMEDTELSPDELFSDERIRIIQSVDQSKAINRFSGGTVILAASGMCDAGRIKHHLKNNLWRQNATVLFVGYQAQGSLGSVIQSGKKRVRIHGKEISVRAKIATINNYSAHGDHDELMAWVKERLPAHGAIFLTHGEDSGRTALKNALVKFGLGSDQVITPQLDDTIELRATGIGKTQSVTAPRIATTDVTIDWHSAYVGFNLDLNEMISSAKNDSERKQIIARLTKALAE